MWVRFQVGQRVFDVLASGACLCRRGGRDVFQVSRAWLLRSSPVWFLIAGVWVLRSSSQACRGVFQVAGVGWLRSSPVWWGVSSSACEWFQVLRSVVFVIFSCSSCFFTRFYFVLEHFHVLFLFILFLLQFSLFWLFKHRSSDQSFVMRFKR